uniref:Putative secreted protein n=1 Tax=Ixodes ricinus TaxID=34613 RepID=A0A6B0U9F3_IXORI
MWCVMLCLMGRVVVTGDVRVENSCSKSSKSDLTCGRSSVEVTGPGASAMPCTDRSVVASRSRVLRMSTRRRKWRRKSAPRMA